MAETIKTPDQSLNQATLFIQEKINLSDALLVNSQRLEISLNGKTGQLVQLIKAGRTTEEMKEAILAYNQESRDYSLMTQELQKLMHSIATLKLFADAAEVKLELDEKDFTRLEFLINGTPEFFYIEGKILKKSDTKEIKDMEKIMDDRIDYDSFIEGLKKTPFFNNPETPPSE